MKLPLVSVITPSYNQGRFIRATIESVLSQDYPHIEYIIIDGGSTDETAAVASEYGSRLTWISEKDRGQSHAINKGFRMAKGEIASWLNSDDTIQPGAVAHAVRAFERNPALGAVYGEGYQMDVDGNVKGRFPFTEPFNLWKLIYLSDYILQQTVYFKKHIFEDIGYLDEELHWGMDWDILIRIGKAFPIEYIPEYMGSLREYATAKSFAGGGKRFHELAGLMRRHGGIRYPPGYVHYGLNTYVDIWTEWIQKHTPRFLDRPSRGLQELLRAFAFQIIVRELRTSQGLYSDGWVGPRLKYMLGAGSGRVAFAGCLPNVGASLENQELRISCNGTDVASFRVPSGDFNFEFDVPAGSQRQACSFEIHATRNFIPRRQGMSPDSRRLAYMLKRFAWAEPGQVIMESKNMADDRLPDEVIERQWFHRIELAPGLFTPGVDDTPRKADLIQLPADLSGKSVLDIGAYDGYFSFEAERRGASRVLAYDHLPPDQSGFNVARRILNSKVEHRVGSVYDLTPEKVGTFDIVLFLGVIYHLRSPLLALERIHSVCNGSLYLESQILPDAPPGNPTIARFFPSNELNNDPTNWWAPTRSCLEAWISSHGFEPVFLAEWSSRAAYRCRKVQDTLSWYVTDY